MVNYMFSNQTSAFSLFPDTDSSKCASTTVSSYYSSVWFTKLNIQYVVLRRLGTFH